MSVTDLTHLTDANQSAASDPNVSAWVSANAGTGKTTVLVRRVLRLLLHRDEATGHFTLPESVLCLTYTKAAAGEMENRLFARLAGWSTLGDEALGTELTELLASPPDAGQRARARHLFATTLDTRGGLKIYTIHAFCERLLHRFPLEANVASGFRVLDEAGKRVLLDASIDAVLERAVHEDGALHPALLEVVASAGEETFREIIEAVLARREALRAIIQLHDDAPFHDAERDALRALLGVPAGADEAGVVADMAALLGDAEIEQAISALRSGTARDQSVADALGDVLTALDEVQRARAFKAVFLRSDGIKPKAVSSLATKAVKENYPHVAEWLFTAHDRFCALASMQAGLRVASSSGALLALADAIINDYEARKRIRGALDYDDLIEKTGQLLQGVSAAAWVLYKLDYGISHILVDEAQDTSPAQWRVVDALSDEFFAGATARQVNRTVFAVGDEKQSIYSFQGARPAEFAKQGRHFARLAGDAEAGWKRVPLTVSFRSTAAVLDAADKVFSRDEAAGGLTFEGDYQPHQAVRAGEAGLVEIWPTMKPEAHDGVDAFQPHLETAASPAPADALAKRIAGTIRGWLDEGTELISQGRAIRPGDILILVPRRGAFTRAMIRELKLNKIAVAGADRIRLAEQLAVQDLMALAEFLLMREDDLALATVLKSPLFGFDDDDLFALAHGRGGSLWRALQGKSGERPDFAEAAERLGVYFARADTMPPYEFFAGLLEENQMAMRHALIARLGADAGDAIDEFLALALAWESDQPPSLQGFLHHVRSANAEIKRDMEQGRDEVRVMTVYGAKGLEAEIVFLPDTCIMPGGRGGATILDAARAAALPGLPDHLVWAPPGTAELKPVQDAKAGRDRAAREEYHRLLYVAMTRARDRLYICGWETKRGREAGCWYDLVFDGLQGLARETMDADGGTVWRYETEQGQETTEDAGQPQLPPEPRPLPDWALAGAPEESPATLPVAPSSILDHAATPAGAPLPEQDADPPDRLADQSRFLRGQIVHALLQHLPALGDAAWAETASRYVKARGSELDEMARRAIVEETLRILNDSDFAPLFGPDSLAEVPLVGRIARAGESGPAFDIAGQIDRLVALDNAVLIVDYKTNRPPPVRPEDVAPGYLAQLAAYRAAIREIFPGKTIRAALLWTDGPHLMEIPRALLDAADAKIRAFAPSP